MPTMSTWATLALAALVATRAVADFQPCGPSSTACCNPLETPAQLCPGGAVCQKCGSTPSCACPAAPGPAPPPGPAPVPIVHKRITVVNGCKSAPIWIAHIASNAVGPDPQDVKIAAGESHRFTTDVGKGGGLSATRFWPKMGCDATGNNCSIGDSGGPGEGCVQRLPSGDNYSLCAPPVDSKFEGTFMPPGSPPDIKDTVDMSIVDGFSLPFKLEPKGGSCIRNGIPDSGLVDCSSLSLSECPTAEKLHGTTYDLRAISPKTGKAGGCYSPCMRLTDDKWVKGPTVAPDSETAAPYCCAGSYGTPTVCTPGPITKTQYVKNVHSTCPNVYAYAYDDKRATVACTTDTQYHITFYCPSTVEDDALPPIFL